MATKTMNEEDYEIAIDTAVAAIEGQYPNNGTQTLATAVIEALADEGWLIEPPRCEHKDGDNAYDCENPVAPGAGTCGRHQ